MTLTTSRLVTASLGIAILALALAPVGFAQESDADLRAEIDELKRGQASIQKELLELRKLLTARPAAPARPSGPDVKGKEFDLADNAVEGEPSARLTLVDFTDYQ